VSIFLLVLGGVSVLLVLVLLLLPSPAEMGLEEDGGGEG